MADRRPQTVGWRRPGHIERKTYDLTSILKFIERVHGLPTLASVNHLFECFTF